ncbi:MAG: hypothetical protein ACYTEX_25555 [Planctomycetota bacterium]|jgi:hypothetical protein
MKWHDARPWLIWLMVAAGCGYLLDEVYHLGRRSAPREVLIVYGLTDTLMIPYDSVMCAQRAFADYFDRTGQIYSRDTLP